jgi:predicted ATPase
MPAEERSLLAASPFHVVTGGPGSGKTTLLEALAALGFGHTIEAGRAIIQDQTSIDGPVLPARDPVLFAEMMLSWEFHSYRMAQSRTGPVFFDRGVPDIAGYYRLIGRAVPDHVTKAAHRFRYQPRVFAAPPWPEIFGHDAERKQSFDEAQRTYEAVTEAYREFGYELVVLPLVSVQERMQFVLDRIGQ